MKKKFLAIIAVAVIFAGCSQTDVNTQTATSDTSNGSVHVTEHVVDPVEKIKNAKITDTTRKLYSTMVSDNTKKQNSINEKYYPEGPFSCQDYFEVMLDNSDEPSVEGAEKYVKEAFSLETELTEFNNDDPDRIFGFFETFYFKDNEETIYTVCYQYDKVFLRRDLRSESND